MGLDIRKNVAGQLINFGLISRSTGLGLPSATVTVKLVKDTGAQGTAAGSVTDKGLGQYQFAPTQGDTNADYLGLVFFADADGAVPVPMHISTTGANQTDGVKLGLTGFPTNFASLSIDASGNVKIQIGVKKNTALANFQFVMRDTAGVPQTGKTVTVTRCIDNAVGFTTMAASAVEISNGAYRVNFSAADLNGNCILFRATASGCADTFISFVTAP